MSKPDQTEIKENKTAVNKIASENGYKKTFENKPNFMVSYQKNGVRINVYMSTLTISTVINHPKKGKTQLHRKKCNIELIKKIFKNPRQHTGLGYYG
ncbi:MAG: hypothetical protein GY853_13985 [PVC group bacterium]|nr:hypothetical protein [PVC group bacterium]